MKRILHVKLVTLILVVLTTSVIAGPSFSKYIGDIIDFDAIDNWDCGTVWYNTNDLNEDEQIEEYEMEIEIEECMDLAASSGEIIERTLTFRGQDYTIEFDEKGNSKITIFVNEYPTVGEEITIDSKILTFNNFRSIVQPH